MAEGKRSDLKEDLALRVLQTKVESNDTDTQTVGQYLIALLAKLWEEEETFSGKRPFGNSGWKYDVYAGLIREGLIDGQFDEDGFIEDFDHNNGDTMITLALDYMRSLTT